MLFTSALLVLVGRTIGLKARGRTYVMLFTSALLVLSLFLTGRMFVLRTYFGQFDELWFVS